ncbi:MAG: BhlA/UviB family holin-like peptide [Angelakisella sp.]
MNNDLLSFFVGDGIWALLSGILIFYILKAQEKRDDRQDARDIQYQTIISNLSESLKNIEDIRDALRDNTPNKNTVCTYTVFLFAYNSQ